MKSGPNCGPGAATGRSGSARMGPARGALAAEQTHVFDEELDGERWTGVG